MIEFPVNQERDIVLFLNEIFIGKSQFGDFLFWFLAEILPYVAIGLAAIFLIFGKDWRRGLILNLAALSAAVISRFFITSAVRIFVERQRPFEVLALAQPFFHSPGESFPSGHAAFFFAIAFLVWLFDKKISIALVTTATLMGMARVALGFHYPSDIFGGAVAAFIVAIVGYILYRKYHGPVV